MLRRLMLRYRYSPRFDEVISGVMHFDAREGYARHTPPEHARAAPRLAFSFSPLLPRLEGRHSAVEWHA